MENLNGSYYLGFRVLGLGFRIWGVIGVYFLAAKLN